MLCETQAVEIYKLKISMMADLFHRFRVGNAGHWMRGKSIPVAVQYGVTSRAIRDIWNRKTWAYASKHLWANESKYSQELNCQEGLSIQVTNRYPPVRSKHSYLSC